MVEEREPAPDFTLMSDSGRPIALSALRGKPVILYFSPKNDSLPPFDKMSA
jgi:peroxiredoxin Q/BCP